MNHRLDSEHKNQQFFKKWLERFNQKLVPVDSVPEPETAENGPSSRPMSLRIAAIFNWLDLPLFWLGILVCVWLMVEYFLILVLKPAIYAEIRVYSNVFLAIAGPGAVGYWTNWLAIKMLFYPKRNNAVWWGLIPARKEELIELMAKTILQRLISPEIIREYLREKRIIKKLMCRTGRALQEIVAEPEFREELKEIIAAFLSDVLTNPQVQEKLYQQINEKVTEWTQLSFKGKLLDWTRKFWEPLLRKILPELPMVVNGVLDHLDAVLDRIPEHLKKENRYLEELLVDLIIQFLHTLDLKKVIKAQFQKLNPDEFEGMLSGSVQTELVFIQTSGGIFGVLVGLAIIYPWMRLVLLMAGLALWMVYRLSVKSHEN